MICPILSKMIKVGDRAITDRLDCLKDKCAWWVPDIYHSPPGPGYDAGQCSIKEIAEALKPDKEL